MDDKIKAIVFDLGRVLIDFDHYRSANRLSALTHLTPQEIYDLFFNSELVLSFEEGKISPEDFFKHVKQLLNIQISFDEFLPIWNDIFFFTDQNKKVYELTKQLKNKYKVALLSNINELHYKHVKDTFGVFDGFDYIFTSCQMKLTKPNPDIYKKALKTMGVASENTFYVDDRPELIEEALKIGIKAFVYKGIEQLYQDLAFCGIQKHHI